MTPRPAENDEQPTRNETTMPPYTELSAPRAPAPSEGLPAPGETWGRYLIERSLGAGGQAEVFQAYGRFGVAGHVALKVSRLPVPDDQVSAWLSAEADALVKLDHPGIVRVVDAGVEGGLPYVATSLVDGLPLDGYVKNEAPAPPRVLDWMLQLTDAVRHAHARGVVHRDLKPQNIVVTPQGRPMIIDFGVSRLISPYDPALPRGISGTPAYMAPEQARGEASADQRVDVFALGGVLKYLLTGSAPYGDSPGSFQAMCEGRVEAVDEGRGSALRRGLARVANRALAAEADKRLGSVDQMHRSLASLRSRRQILVALGGGVAAISVAALGWRLLAPAGPPPAASGELTIHFQRANQSGSYQVLTADLLPLVSGDRIQVQVRFSQPLCPYLLGASTDGQLAVLYPPEDQVPGAVRELSVPADRDEWLPLTGPGGTQTILLLACRQAGRTASQVRQELEQLGSAPAIDGVGMLLAEGKGVRLIANPAATHRAIGSKAVRAEKGLLAGLMERVPRDWAMVRALSFTHLPAERQVRPDPASRGALDDGPDGPR